MKVLRRRQEIAHLRTSDPLVRKAWLAEGNPRGGMCPCCGQAASAPVCEWCRFDSSDDDARAGLQRYRDDAVERRRSSLRGRLTRWWAVGPRAFHAEAREQSALLRHLLKWLALGAVVGVLAGASAAVFLYGLGLVTSAREASPWLLAFLPLGGFAVGLAYHYVGGRAASGNALILDEIHGVAPEGDKPSSDESWVPAGSLRWCSSAPGSPTCSGGRPVARAPRYR